MPVDTTMTVRPAEGIRLTMEMGTRASSGSAAGTDFVPVVTIFADRSLASLLAQGIGHGDVYAAGDDALPAGRPPAYRITWTWPRLHGPSEAADAARDVMVTTSMVWDSAAGGRGTRPPLLP